MRRLLTALMAGVAAVTVVGCGSSAVTHTSGPGNATNVAYHPGEACKAPTRVAQVKYWIHYFYCDLGTHELVRGLGPPSDVERLKGSGVNCNARDQKRYRSMGEVCRHRTLYSLKN